MCSDIGARCACAHNLPYFVLPPFPTEKEKCAALQAGLWHPVHTPGLSLTLSKQGIDPAKAVRPLSTPVRCSDPCRTRSLAGGLVLQVHLPVLDGPEAGDRMNKKPFSVQLALLCSTPHSPALSWACPLPHGTHIYAVLARWSRGSSGSRRALWSYSLEGLGG